MKAVVQWVLKTMMKDQTGIVRTMPKKDLVDLNVAITAERLMRNGIDPNALKNANQVENAINQIEAPRNVQQGIKSAKPAKVMDMEGKEIDPRSKIMGGKQSETEAEILARINKENKKGIAGIKNKRQLTEDEYQEFLDEVGGADQLEAYNFDGTVGDAKRILKEQKEYMDDMFMEYKKGNLDPVAGDKSPARKKFLQNKYEEMQMSGDNRLMTQDEIEELSTFDLQTDMDKAVEKFKKKDAKEKKIIKDFDPGDREPNAQGGRIGYKDGPDMGRRSFLKILGGLAAIPIVGKFLKPIKTAKGIKSVPIIKTGDVPGKPEWFDALVNKVILEGDDVTKKFATQERQIVHMKKIDDDTSVTVTQDLNDGSIIVDVDDPIRNVMGESGQDTSVQMMLKKGQADETTKGTPADEFSFTENDMRNYMDGPDDYTTEFVENTVDKMSDLTSDLGKIKSYATGKGPTMKQIVESKKRKDMVKFAEKNPSEYAANRGPDVVQIDYDYASGGIARMLGE